ncbi:hypothetical protein [Pelagibius sp. Alg239-R121]|uniref:hypothetical protein n=1 Tax=Pelagibius sp. Alg239-R121 TaxID=2993448 RepID=UPI0024A72472|nr:hypothetical protein [Pelagibius sp. Alg239-R121]
MIGRFGKNAMTVVSMDSQAFDRDYLISTIAMCAKIHARLHIVLADDLYCYNRPVFDDDPNEIYKLVRDRFRYVENAIQRSEKGKLEVLVQSWRQFCTPEFIDILRRVYMLIVSEHTLVAAVRERTDHFIKRSRPGISHLTKDDLIARSRAYVVEETAMSLHLASSQNITDEYYPGDHAPILHLIYNIIDKDQLYEKLSLKSHEKRFWNIEQSNGRFRRTIEWSNGPGRMDI